MFKNSNLKITIICALIFFSKSIIAQVEYCDALKLALHSKEFKILLGKSFADSTKIMFDSENKISHCSLEPFDSITFVFSNDSSYKKLSPNVYNKFVSKHLIIIYGIENNNNEFSIRFWKPINNATLGFFFKKGKTKLEINNIEEGVF
ncbi:MAG: hypothetical protein A3K10_03310 [Bacteroidetes bacterium RIFCSPLOWO2_12_FULL_31_6]|nr:MAG: hypothetical protein A3K10_03310 [Bacteroidetes bacterium RIFCSPLOWO2_12_FULL_31_6]